MEVLESLLRRLDVAGLTGEDPSGVLWAFQRSGSLPFEIDGLARHERPEINNEAIRHMNPVDDVSVVAATPTDSPPVVAPSAPAAAPTAEATAAPASNSTWQPIGIGGSNNNWTVSLSGENHVGEPAIYAWADEISAVRLTESRPPYDGSIIVGVLVSPMQNGWYQYEYAIQNVNAHRSVQQVSIPIPLGGKVLNPNFRSLPYHSGNVYDN